MKRYFHLLLLMTLLPLAGWAQNVSWKSGASTEEVPFGLSGADLSSLAGRLNVTSGYGNEPCVFNTTNAYFPSGTNQYNLALYRNVVDAINKTGIVTTTCETGQEYYLNVSVYHRKEAGSWGQTTVLKLLKIVRADNKITSPFIH